MIYKLILTLVAIFSLKTFSAEVNDREISIDVKKKQIQIIKILVSTNNQTNTPIQK